MSDKPHEPSEQKLRQAREQGNVPRSKVLGSAGATAGGLLGLWLGSAQGLPLLKTLAVRSWALETSTLHELVPLTVLAAAWLVGPALVLAGLGATVSSIAVAGATFRPQVLAPDLSRVNPVQGLGRLFSVKSALDVARTALLGGVVAWVTVAPLWEVLPRLWPLVTHDGPVALHAALRLLAGPLTRGLAVLVLVGVVDAVLARRRHRKELMMTHEEVKQEHKNSEGDPHQKSKRKALQKQLAQGGPARGVQKATAVVVNPTHIAVAIRWAEDECEAPYLVAKGRDEDAMELRKEAKSLNIPIVKDIPLARALVHYDVGEEVPEELYRAAAAVLRVALEASTAQDARPAGSQP